MLPEHFEIHLTGDPGKEQRFGAKIATIRSGARLSQVQKSVCIHIVGLEGLTEILKVHACLVAVIVVLNEQFSIFTMWEHSVLLKAVYELRHVKGAHSVPVDHIERI